MSTPPQSEESRGEDDLKKVRSVAAAAVALRRTFSGESSTSSETDKVAKVGRVDPDGSSSTGKSEKGKKEIEPPSGSNKDEKQGGENKSDGVTDEDKKPAAVTRQDDDGTLQISTKKDNDENKAGSGTETTPTNDDSKQKSIEDTGDSKEKKDEVTGTKSILDPKVTITDSQQSEDVVSPQKKSADESPKRKPGIGKRKRQGSSDTMHEKGDRSHADGSNFPQKLMEILSNPDLRDVVTWLPHGKSFFVMKPKKFSTTVVPRYFNKKVEYRSFTRRLLRWGFKRISKGTETGAYYHELFLRDNPELCEHIETSQKSTGSFTSGMAPTEDEEDAGSSLGTRPIPAALQASQQSSHSSTRDTSEQLSARGTNIDRSMTQRLPQQEISPDQLSRLPLSQRMRAQQNIHEDLLRSVSSANPDIWQRNLLRLAQERDATAAELRERRALESRFGRSGAEAGLTSTFPQSSPYRGNTYRRSSPVEPFLPSLASQYSPSAARQSLLSEQQRLLGSDSGLRRGMDSMQARADALGISKAAQGVLERHSGLRRSSPLEGSLGRQSGLEGSLGRQSGFEGSLGRDASWAHANSLERSLDRQSMGRQGGADSSLDLHASLGRQSSLDTTFERQAGLGRHGNLDSGLEGSGGVGRQSSLEETLERRAALERQADFERQAGFGRRMDSGLDRQGGLGLERQAELGRLGGLDSSLERQAALGRQSGLEASLERQAALDRQSGFEATLERERRAALERQSDLEATLERERRAALERQSGLEASLERQAALARQSGFEATLERQANLARQSGLDSSLDRHDSLGRQRGLEAGLGLGRQWDSLERQAGSGRQSELERQSNLEAIERQASLERQRRLEAERQSGLGLQGNLDATFGRQGGFGRRDSLEGSLDSNSSLGRQSSLEALEHRASLERQANLERQALLERQANLGRQAGLDHQASLEASLSRRASYERQLSLASFQGRGPHFAAKPSPARMTERAERDWAARQAGPMESTKTSLEKELESKKRKTERSSPDR